MNEELEALQLGGKGRMAHDLRVPMAGVAEDESGLKSQGDEPEQSGGGRETG